VSVDIVAENALNADWTLADLQGAQIGTTGGDTYGFSRRISYNVGETAQFSIHGPGTIIHIIRTGYYANAKGWRIVDTITNTPTTQAEATVIPGSNNGTTCTHWTVTAEWEIPTTAVSGIYMAMIRNGANNNATYVTFVVRDDAADVDIIYKTSDLTWGAAYNHFGTIANRNGADVYGSGTGVGNIMDRCFAVSYHRPVLTTYDVPLTYWWSNELPLIRYLERNGFSVKYVTGVDLEEQGHALLDKGKTFISNGHDEYWSSGMRDAVEYYRDVLGKHSIFMSGNEVFWKTRLVTTGDETVMWCYKDTMPGPSGYSRAAGSPLDPVEWTGTWKDTRWADRRPEWLLTGTSFRMNAVSDGLTDVIIANNPYGGHKVWGDSVLTESDLTIQRIVGFEADDVWPTQPTGSYKLLATYSRVLSGVLADANGQNYNESGTLNWGVVAQRYDSGAVTVGFGTCQWSWLLDSTHARGSGTEVNAAGQQMVMNLLRGLGATPGTPMGSLVSTSTPMTLTELAGEVPGTVAIPNSGSWYDYSGTLLKPYTMVSGVLVPLFEDDTPINGDIYVDIYVDSY